MKIRKNTLLALPLAALIAAPAMAQSSQPQTTAQVQNQVDQQSTAPAQSQTSSQPATTTQGSASADANRQPLELQSKEGFWGHLNPFARKKYVRRQLTPVVGR